MKITEDQLTKRVERWQRTLSPLGVAHWRVEGVSVVDETSGGYGCNATAAMSNLYDSVAFEFTHDFLAATDAKHLDEVIVHEWVHVAMRDFDQAISTAEGWLPPFSDVRQVIDRQREAVIDRVARLVCTLHG